MTEERRRAKACGCFVQRIDCGSRQLLASGGAAGAQVGVEVGDVLVDKQAVSTQVTAVTAVGADAGGRRSSDACGESSAPAWLGALVLLSLTGLPQMLVLLPLALFAGRREVASPDGLAP